MIQRFHSEKLVYRFHPWELIQSYRLNICIRNECKVTMILVYNIVSTLTYSTQFMKDSRINITAVSLAKTKAASILVQDTILVKNLHAFQQITDMQIMFENIPNFSEESLTIPKREFNNNKMSNSLHLFYIFNF